MVKNSKTHLMPSLREGFFREALVLTDIAMDIFSELLRNVLATLVSTVTIVIMFFRFMNRERLQHAKQIAEVIEKTASHVFNTSKLENRVQQLEKTEKEKSESIDKQFALVHSRLDQIYSIIAGLNK
jgi:Glu-tRNA(Gln) amidotransferase subunit E-like FAD-binding protein